MIKLDSIRKQLRRKRLPKAEETELVMKAKAGDEAARNRLLYANLLYLQSISFRYAKLFGSTISVDELFQEACIYFFRSIHAYEPGRTENTSFYSCFNLHVRANLHEYCRQQVNKLRNGEYKAVVVNESSFTSEDSEPMSLDRFEGDCKNPEELYAQAEQDSIVRKVSDIYLSSVKASPERDAVKFVLDGEQIMLSDIARKYKISRQAVDQRKNKAYKAIKKDLVEKYNLSLY